MENQKYTLPKSKRLNSKSIIERLFAGGNHSFPTFPMRVVYMWVDPNEFDVPPVSMLVSVPKKRFKRAVKRNHVKRQVREAFRLQQFLLSDLLAAHPDQRLVLGFIWLDNQLHETEEIHFKMKKLLLHIIEDMK